MSRNLSSLLFICFLLPLLHSCGGSLSYIEASQHGRWNEAIVALEKEYKSTKNLEDKKIIAGQLGEMYLKVNNYSKAKTYLKMAVRDGAADPATLGTYADALKSTGDYDEALIQLKKYQELVPGDPKTAEKIKLCEEAIEWEENPQETRYRIELQKLLSNGKSHDFAPVIMPEGLVFTSNRTGDKSKLGSSKGNGESQYYAEGTNRPDLFIAREQKGKKAKGLARPELFESEDVINTVWSEGSAAFDPKGKVMIYTSCNREYVQNELTKNDSNCVLMSSERKGRAWSAPERLPFCTDSTKAIHYGHPSLSEDGQTLYFSSNMPGGYGGHDIWMSTYVKRSNTWSDPINVGKSVNSGRDEMYPHVYGNALYYASNGHPGLGGLDVFVSYGRGQEWTAPKNLKAPMNSEGDDFSIFFERDRKKTRRSGDYGYFASNRGSNLGVDNIYSFNMVPLNFTLEGFVYDNKTKEPLKNARVTMTFDTSKVFVMTNEVGYYFMKLNPEENYKLRPYMERYDNNNPDPTVSTFDYEVSMQFERDMYLDPMVVEFELDILYDLDDDKINAKAAVLLDEFSLKLKEHWYTTMELSSHTDCRGSQDYNRDLAQRRAESAVNYLVSKGIERERFVAKGYGEDKLKNDCGCEGTTGKGLNCTDEQHQENRRTEIRILSMEYEPKVKVEEEAQIYVDPDSLLEEEEEIEEEGE